MKVTVNSSCIGCGLCVDVADGVFEMKDGVSVPTGKADLNNPKVKEDTKTAVELCPVQAIEVTEDQ